MQKSALIQAISQLGHTEYTDYLRICAALVSEFGVDVALDILTEAGIVALDKKRGDTERRLRKPLRSISFGTLIHLLRQHGIDTRDLTSGTRSDAPFTPRPKAVPAPIPPSQMQPPLYNSEGKRLYRFSVSTKARNKEILCSMHDFQSSFTHGATAFQGLCNAVYRGYAICPAILGGDGRRKSANFTGGELALVDIDSGLLMEEAAEMTLTGKCLFMYSTPSHTPSAHRFRIVFALEGLETVPEQYAAMTRELIQYYGADEACKDVSRFYYGSTDPTLYIPRYGGFVRYSEKHGGEVQA